MSKRLLVEFRLQGQSQNSGSKEEEDRGERLVEMAAKVKQVFERVYLRLYQINMHV